MKSRQTGLTTVEFAIVGALFFIVLFGVLEFARLLFTWNTLDEATRRGARIAAVCRPPPPYSTGDVNAIKCATIFEPLDNQQTCSNACTADTASPILSGLTAKHVDVKYLNSDGATEAANLGAIRYVKVSIKTDATVHYELPLSIPFLDLKPWAPSFETTLPRESLGFIPGP